MANHNNNQEIIDLRSDTVTRPSQAMLEAMIKAPVGDDVYGEDPTVIALEKLASEMLGKEAAIFTPSGTQSNLIGLLSHCQRGDEYIVGQHAHTFKYEAGGAAVLGSIQPQPLDFEQDGTLDLEKVARAIKPDDFHFAKTKLLCLENTHNGIALPNQYLSSLKSFSSKHSLALHLDGARLFNAAVKTKIPAREIAASFDSISICLSKGLGAPVGSLLVASHSIVHHARRWRKMVGGGMRQAGILAEAGIYALNNNIERLTEDHENAVLLANGLREIHEIAVEHTTKQTNMIFIEVDKEVGKKLPAFLATKGIVISGGSRIRLVTHMDISEQDTLKIISAFKDFHTGQH